jgi:hypothetical protein
VQKNNQLILNQLKLEQENNEALKEEIMKLRDILQ